MGRPKAFLPGPGGAPLIEVALNALRAAGAEHLLIGANDPAPFASLGVRVVPDATPGRGPVEGVLALLEASPTAWTLVVACDMPQLDPAVLRGLVERALSLEAGRDAVVPRTAGRLQPLHAVYHQRATEKILSARLAGVDRLTTVVESLDLDVPTLPDGPSFRNLNTPDDLDELGRGRGAPL